jgi:hypothetical protein
MKDVHLLECSTYDNRTGRINARTIIGAFTHSSLAERWRDAESARYGRAVGRPVTGRYSRMVRQEEITVVYRVVSSPVVSTEPTV